MTQILEAVMLICFGLSWPINVMKNIKSRTTRNMSLNFTFLIMAGYVAGIAAKVYLHAYNYVLAVYVLNLLIVSANVAVYFVNRRYDRSAAVAVRTAAPGRNAAPVAHTSGSVLESTAAAPAAQGRIMMSALMEEFSSKAERLEALSEELDRDFLQVSSAEGSLLIEDVSHSLNEAARQMERVLFLEKRRAEQKRTELKRA